MSKLDRWLPFKFRRKNKEENKQEAPTQEHALARAQQTAPLAPFHSPFFSGPMNELVQSFFGEPFPSDPFRHFEQMDRWFGDFSPKRFAPSVDVSDDGKALKVTAELPGMSKEDVELHLDGDLLVIRGEKKGENDNKDEGVFRTERYYGYFQRAVPLPDDVDRDHAEASFAKGVLTVRFPKLEAAKAKARQIEIKT